VLRYERSVTVSAPADRQHGQVRAFAGFVLTVGVGAVGQANDHGAAGLAHTRPVGASGGLVHLGGDDGFLATGKRPRGAAVSAARPPVALRRLLDEVAIRVGGAVARAFV
jgi:hypothetical protein